MAAQCENSMTTLTESNSILLKLMDDQELEAQCQFHQHPKTEIRMMMMMMMMMTQLFETTRFEEVCNGKR
jgi:hypothetical protein